jgi:hypothetical protein
MIKTIITSFIVTVLTLTAFVQFFPFHGFGQNLGIANLTDLNSADTVSDFPTIYTNNNTTLENAINTLEGTTTMSLVTSIPNLSTVGTLTTGTWNADTITVAKGGTGSTTLLSGGVLYGNGTGNVLATQACSDNQVIQWTSGVPACSTFTIDQTANYTWTGYHDFNDFEFANASGTNATTTDTHNVENLVVNTNINNQPIAGISLFASTTKYTTTGANTWTKPSGAVYVCVELWGGGGSGGTDTGNQNASGGGGGGAYATHCYDADDLGGTETVTVGAGGAAVTGASDNGNNGGASSFGSHVSVGGGVGGVYSVTDPDGGDGGTVGSVGVDAFFGQGGEEGVDHGNGSGNGGDGLYSAGGGSSQDGGDNGGDSIYGGGGGGGQNGTGGASTFGGAGGAGCTGSSDAVAGSAPAGGGGAGGCNFGDEDSGAGGDGMAIITTWY